MGSKEVTKGRALGQIWPRNKRNNSISLSSHSPDVIEGIFLDNWRTALEDGGALYFLIHLRGGKRRGYIQSGDCLGCNVRGERGIKYSQLEVDIPNKVLHIKKGAVMVPYSSISDVSFDRFDKTKWQRVYS
jgi:hypothetical protein